jgi:putative addiction module component (TIGR02574 family)
MSDKRDVLAAALELPEDDRVALVGELLESVEGPPEARDDAEWDHETARRVKSLDAGTAKTMSWAEARKRIVGE